MKLSAYLSLSRHGVFYFRWPLPRTDRDCRPYVRVSLRTRCPVKAGTLARYLASCGEITRDNKELARLRQDKLRELVRGYFDVQLAPYLEWINNRGLSATAVEDARSEMLDHEDHLHSQRPTEMYLPINRFKRKMDVSDEECLGSGPVLVSKPEHDGCGEGGGGEEDLRASVVSRVATLRQSFRRPNMISILLRRLERRLSYLTGLPRDFRPGVKGDQI